MTVDMRVFNPGPRRPDVDTKLVSFTIPVALWEKVMSLVPSHFLSFSDAARHAIVDMTLYHAHPLPKNKDIEFDAAAHRWVCVHCRRRWSSKKGAANHVVGCQERPSMRGGRQ